MGYKCPDCGTDNGITFYYGKVCKRCGKELVLKIDKNLKKKVKKEIKKEENSK